MSYTIQNEINVGNVIRSILMLPLLIMAKEKKIHQKSKANLFCKILINIKKFFFRPFGPQFGPKIRGGGRGGGASQAPPLVLCKGTAQEVSFEG